MTRFRYWRKMTWAIVLGSAVMAVFVVRGGFAPGVIALSLFGLLALGFIWFMTRALWRVGHGTRLRQMRSVAIPWKSPESLTGTQG